MSASDAAAASDVPVVPAFPPDDGGGLRGWWRRREPGLVAFTAGLVLMTVEMAAGRLVSRHVGSSIHTWTAVIGVIFAGTSLGYYIGGRLAARFRPKVILGELLLLASASCAMILWLTPLLNTAISPAKWPQPEFALTTAWRLGPDGLAALAEEPLPPETLAKLAGLRGKPFADRAELAAAAAGVLSPDEIDAHADRIWLTARVVRALDETGLRDLADQGAPEGVLAGARAVKGRPFDDWDALAGALADAAPIPREELERWAPAVWQASEPVRSPVRAELTDRSLALLSRPAFSEGSVSALRQRTAGRVFETRGALAAALGEALAAGEAGRLTAALDAAEPVGPAWQAMREDALPDECVAALTRTFPEPRRDLRDPSAGGRPVDLVGASTADADLFRARVRAALENHQPAVRRVGFAGLDAAVETVVRSARGEPPFPFPTRLLIVVALVFLTPAVALGMVSPVAAQMALDLGRGGGRAVGGVAAWGAWGSIAGTFLSGFVLLSVLGTHRVVMASALATALLAVLTCPPRLLQTAWLLLLGMLALPVFHQAREPDALDPKPDRLEKADAEAGLLRRTWAALPAEVGRLLHIRDPELGADAAESDYQFLKVTREDRSDGAAGEVLSLSLDHLVHGYLHTQAAPGKPYSFETAVIDHSRFGYDALQAYAAVLGRSLRERFAPDPADPERLVPPRVRGLCLGGGSYTFERNIVAIYAGERYAVRSGDSLRTIAAARYGAEADSDRRDTLERIALHNRAALERAGAWGADPDAPLPAGLELSLPSLIDVAELDPAVTEINHTRLKLPRPDADPRIKTWNYDARNFVEAAADSGWTGKYDFVSSDCVNHYNVPAHLTTREFNDRVKMLLRPGGVFLALVIDRYETARFVSAFAGTLRQSYRHVYVLVDKSPARRKGREVFMLAATDRDAGLDLDFLGGFPGDVMELVRDGDTVRLAGRLSAADPAGLARLKARAAAEGAKALFDELVRRKRLDLAALSPEPPRRWSVDLEFKSVALTPAEIDRELIAPGRAPGLIASLRGWAVVRRLTGRPAGEFRLTEAALADGGALAGLPDAVKERLRPLVGEGPFVAEALADRLAEVLTREQIRRHKPAITAAARDRSAGLRPPLILTDSSAPVDELLAPLLEED